MPQTHSPRDLLEEAKVAVHQCSILRGVALEAIEEGLTGGGLVT